LASSYCDGGVDGKKLLQLGVHIPFDICSTLKNVWRFCIQDTSVNGGGGGPYQFHTWQTTTMLATRPGYSPEDLMIPKLYLEKLMFADRMPKGPQWFLM
jgi:hypothetical protein